MNARLAIRLARPAAPHAKRRPCAVTVRAMRLVIAQWHVAECQHIVAGTTPADQIPTDAENEQVHRLMAVSRLGGC